MPPRQPRDGGLLARTFSDRMMPRRTEAAGGFARGYKCSVTDREGLRAMVKRIDEEVGPIDTLVNNAGIGQVLPLALMEEADWDHMLDTHVKGAFLTTQAVMRGMIRRKHGAILNVSSLAGVRMVRAPVHYCTAKAAMRVWLLTS